MGSLERFGTFIFQRIEVDFASEIPLTDSVSRLRQATSRSVFASLSHEFVAGRVEADDVRLERVQPFFDVQSFGGRFVDAALGEKLREGLRRAGFVS